MTKLLAFHGSQEIKNKYVNRILHHRREESLVQGEGYDSETSKGCAVGCTLENYDHLQYPIELGLPVWLARLEDTIFEGLDYLRAEQFAVDFLTTIKPGSDVSDVRRLLAIRRQRLNLKRLESNVTDCAQACKLCITDIIAWHEGGELEEDRVLPFEADHPSPSLQTLNEQIARHALDSLRTTLMLTMNSDDDARRSLAKEYYRVEAALSSAMASIGVESTSDALSAARAARVYGSRYYGGKHLDWEAANLLELLSQAPVHKELNE